MSTLKKIGANIDLPSRDTFPDPERRNEDLILYMHTE